jgi:cytochrome c-type biogenesis protein CcmE
MRVKYIIGGAIIVLFTIWTAVSFKKSLTPYVTISEAKERGTTVQVKGERVDDGAFDADNNLFRFRIKDDNGEVVEVIYDGPKPGNFDQASYVVCVGKFENNKFHAKNILVKCPSKYQQEGAGS